jgi:hypothetical protein
MLHRPSSCIKLMSHQIQCRRRKTGRHPARRSFRHPWPAPECDVVEIGFNGRFATWACRNSRIAPPLKKAGRLGEQLLQKKGLQRIPDRFD